MRSGEPAGMMAPQDFRSQSLLCCLQRARDCGNLSTLRFNGRSEFGWCAAARGCTHLRQSLPDSLIGCDLSDVGSDALTQRGWHVARAKEAGYGTEREVWKTCFSDGGNIRRDGGAAAIEEREQP